METITTEYLVFYGLTLAAALIGLFNFSKLDPPLRLVAIYIAGSALIETISTYYVDICDPPKNNLHILNTFILLEGVTLLLYFKEIITAKWAASSIRVILISFLLLWLASCAWYGVTQELFILLTGLAQFILLLLAFTHFGQLLDSLQHSRIEYNPYFWINFGILLCVVVGITAVFSYQYLPGNSEILNAVWSLVRYSRILLALFISLGFYMNLKYGRN